MLLTSRRTFLGGLLSALDAPAIVHAGNAAHQMVRYLADRCMANGFEGGVRYTHPTTVDFTQLSDFGATT